MKQSRLLGKTLREIPKDAQTAAQGFQLALLFGHSLHVHHFRLGAYLPSGNE